MSRLRTADGHAWLDSAQTLREPAVMVPTPQSSFDSDVFGHSFNSSSA